MHLGQDKMDSFLMCLGFTKNKEYSNLYFKVEGERPVILLLYVDDLFLTGGNELIANAKRSFVAEFEMKDLGMMHYFLGMEVWKNADRIFLGEGKYVVEILKKFRMLDHKVIATPMALNLKLLCDASLESVDGTMYRQMIGSLMYLTNMRPDICFTANTLRQFMTDPRHVHLIVAKHVPRYIKVQWIMGSNMLRIRILTYMVMLILIGKVAPLRGRALWVVTSVWDLE